MAKKKKPSGDDLVEIKITCHNAAGKYLLPYSYGRTVKLEAKQAKELIDAKDAEPA